MSPWMARVFLDALPPDAHASPSSWAAEHVVMVKSSRSRAFDPLGVPWNVEPLDVACGGEATSVTYVGPVQSGKSATGEAAVCYWLANESSGDIQVNWENDRKSDARWASRFEPILLDCAPVMRKAPSRARQDGRWKTGKVHFPGMTLTYQGVFVPEHLDSETVRFMVNEEVHNWKPGMLAKSYNRVSAVWNHVVLNLSCAGESGSQLHRKFLEGTQQHWEVLCPGCGQRHRMRTKWEPDHPELGGLRYDADGHRTADGGYDYPAIARTVRYQFPCGHQMKDDRVARRQLSVTGAYSRGDNPGANPRHRSYTMDAVSVDWIPWLDLIQEKHAALKALGRGDPEPWWRYLAERECVFYEPNQDRPTQGKVVLTFGVRKNREGLPDRVARFGALDRQQGRLRDGELPHWWAVIRDVDRKGNSRLVFEGRMDTDDDAAEVMSGHAVDPCSVVADSGDDTVAVYKFCLRHGFNAIKGGRGPLYAHPDGSHRVFSPEKPLYLMVGSAFPFAEDPAKEPLFWHYSPGGIRDVLASLRGAQDTKWEVPADVSRAYLDHMAAEELEERRSGDGSLERRWVQRRDRNDLFVCECYLAMMMKMAGLV